MKMSRKILMFIIIIIFTLTSICTIQNNKYTNAQIFQRKPVQVAVLFYSFDDLFHQELKQNLENIQKENKDKVQFTFYDGKNNIAIQNESLDSILNGNTDLIFGNLADVHENFVDDFILKVKKKNVPLVLLDISQQIVSKVSKNYNKVAFILPDSKNAGIQQGKILVDLWNTNRGALDKNGDNILQYVLLHGEVNNPAAIDRTKYAILTINDSGIKTQELALVNANWLKEFAKDSIDNLFLKYNGRIEAIISNNDAMAIGAIESLQKYGYNKGDKAKNMEVVGIDGLSEAKDLINEGLMTGTVVQDPKIMAEVFYNVGMNLVNNLNPTENTNYEIVDGEIIIPFPYEQYTKKS